MNIEYGKRINTYKNIICLILIQNMLKVRFSFLEHRTL